MPTKEKLLEELKNNFGLVTVDYLNEYEKSIYLSDEYSNYRENEDSNVLPESFTDELREFENYYKHPEAYVEKLRENDDTIKEYDNTIAKLNKENEGFALESNNLKKEIDEKNSTIINNKKSINSLNKEISELEGILASFDKKSKTKIESAISDFKHNKKQELKTKEDSRKSKIVEDYELKKSEIEKEAEIKIEELAKISHEAYVEYNNFFLKRQSLEQQKKENLAELEGIEIKMRGLDHESQEYIMLKSDKEMKEARHNSFEKALMAIEPELIEADKEYGRRELEVCEARNKRTKDLEDLKENTKKSLNSITEADYSEIDKQAKELEEKMKADDAKELRELTDKLNTKKANYKELTDINDTLPSDINKANERINVLNNLTKENKNKCYKSSNDQLDYAKNKANARLDEMRPVIDNANKFALIHKALHRKEAIVTKDNIFTGLRIVKQSYSNFYNNHNLFSRFWAKVFNAGPAAKDYEAFNAVRNDYIKYTKIAKADINNYLDNDAFSGKLDEYSQKLTQKELDKYLIIDLALNNDYSKKELATTDEYLKGIEKFCENEYKGAQLIPLNYRYVTIGCRILKDLDELRAHNPSNRINEVIDKVKAVALINIGPGQTENYVNNILAPADKRQNFIYHFEDLKVEKNAVLMANDITFAKKEKNVIQVEIPNAEIEGEKADEEVKVNEPEVKMIRERDYIDDVIEEAEEYAKNNPYMHGEENNNDDVCSDYESVDEISN